MLISLLCFVHVPAMLWLRDSAVLAPLKTARARASCRSTPVGRSVSSAQAVLTGLLPEGAQTGAIDRHVIRLNRGPQWMVYSEATLVILL